MSSVDGNTKPLVALKALFNVLATDDEAAAQAGVAFCTHIGSFTAMQRPAGVAAQSA